MLKMQQLLLSFTADFLLLMHFPLYPDMTRKRNSLQRSGMRGKNMFFTENVLAVVL